MQLTRPLALVLTLSLAPLTLAHEGHDHKNAPPDAAAVTECVRTGAGANTYETVPNWCKIPGGRQVLGATHGGIVVDKAGLIYFSMDAGEHGLLVYKPDGTFVKGIAPNLLGCHGLFIREEDGKEYIYAAHLKGQRAVKLSLDGEVLWEIGLPKESGKYPDPKAYKPTAIAVAPNGDIFIADGYGLSWVHQYDKDRKYLRSFGGKGKEPGQFQTCHGLGLDTRGEKPLLLVCDRENRRLQHYDLDGNFVAVITENLRRPCSVSFHGDQIAVAELEGRVVIIGKDNKVAAELGSNPDRAQWAKFGVPPTDWKEGIFTAPHGVSFDADGNVYVMDWNQSGRLSKLKLMKAAE